MTMRRAILCTLCAAIGIWCAGASVSDFVFGSSGEGAFLAECAIALFGAFTVLFVSRRP